MRLLLIFGVLLCMQCHLFGQKTIFIDGKFDDWDNTDPVFVDDTGDGQNNGIDIKRIWAINDQSNIYFRFELTKEINLQENNDLAIYIDYDNDINTGFKINGIGAELRYFFGERFGIIQDGSDFDFVNFFPVGMLVAPSVSSTEFEISVQRQINESGISFSANSTITFRLEDNSFNGDEAPNNFTGIDYEIDLSNTSIIPEPTLSRNGNTSVRLMTYNILNDQLFDPSKRSAFERIFKATNPDIIALQEVRNFNSLETKNIIEDFLPGETWYHKKHGFDIVTISKYPIKFSESVDGNAAFYLDLEGKDMLLINCHLPCCENDSDRQTEVDIIMEYIRDLKEGNGSTPFEEGSPIIIAGDMNFVGDSNQPYTFRTGDIFNNGFYGPDFLPDWDETELKDVDSYATNTYGNFTWININGSFFPGKLDWIFYTDSKMSLENSYSLYTPGLSAETLQEYNLEFNDVLFASDHLPVIADFGFSSVGLEDFLDLEIALYPNPTSDFLNIEVKDFKVNTIKIFNQTGQLLIKQAAKNSTDRIDVSSLSPGAYFIIIETTKGKIAKPFLKVK